MTERMTGPDAPMSGEEFRSRLRELGRSDTAFADEIGCSGRSVSRWVRNGPPPEVAYLVDLLVTLEVHVGPPARRIDAASKPRGFDAELDRLLRQATANGDRAAFLECVDHWLKRTQRTLSSADGGT